MNVTTSVWRGYIFILTRRQNLTLYLGYRRTIQQVIQILQPWELKHLCLIQESYSLVTRSAIVPCTTFLRNRIKCVDSFSLSFEFLIQARSIPFFLSSIFNFCVQRAKRPHTRKIANVDCKPVRVSIFRVQNYCVFHKPLCNISSKICIFSSK